MDDIRLKPGRDKQARTRHPWIFSGAIAAEPRVKAGEIVRVLAGNGDFLAYGHYSPSSQIRVRLLEWAEDRKIDDEWWYARIQSAIQNRAKLALNKDTNAYRLIFSESDFLPGLIVDRYGDYLVMQVLSVGMDRAKDRVVAIIQELLQPLGIFERSDADVRPMEGLKPIKKNLFGIAPPETYEIRENGFTFQVNLQSGQKTGFYFDQRENRRRTAAYASGGEVLDAFCYTGGFGLNALANMAKSVTLLDSSQPALEAAWTNAKLNNLMPPGISFMHGDAFDILRQKKKLDRHFDLIILDPPKLAPIKSSLKKAERAYKDLNMAAMNLLRPGGILATFSCSGNVSRAHFQQVLAWAATDARRDVQILELLGQGEDHPIRLSFPEGEYLKGFICRVND